MYIEVVVVCALLTVADAAKYRSSLEEKPDKFKEVKGCYVSALDKVVPVGETEPSPTDCVLYRCDEKLYDVFSCVLVEGDPPCKTVRPEASKTYPDCCPRVECPVLEEITTEK